MLNLDFRVTYFKKKNKQQISVNTETAFVKHLKL
jgi:hypothetical protein